MLTTPAVLSRSSSSVVCLSEQHACTESTSLGKARLVGDFSVTLDDWIFACGHFNQLLVTGSQEGLSCCCQMLVGRGISRDGKQEGMQPNQEGQMRLQKKA